MKKKGLFRALSTVLCCAVSASAMATLASCNSKKKKDSIVLMTERFVQSVLCYRRYGHGRSRYDADRYAFDG